MSACINICFGDVIVSWNSWFLWVSYFAKKKNVIFFLWSSRVYRDTHKKHQQTLGVFYCRTCWVTIWQDDSLWISTISIHDCTLHVAWHAWHAYDCLWISKRHLLILTQSGWRVRLCPCAFFWCQSSKWEGNSGHAQWQHIWTCWSIWTKRYVEAKKHASRQVKKRLRMQVWPSKHEEPKLKLR